MEICHQAGIQDIQVVQNWGVFTRFYFKFEDIVDLIKSERKRDTERKQNRKREAES